MKKVLWLAIPVLALTAGGWRSADAAQSAEKTRTMAVEGTVKWLAPDTLVVTAGGKDWTFAVDSSTKVIGQGAGTKAAPTGGRAVITDLLRAGDMISVTYHDAGTMMHAASIYVTNRAYWTR